ncbi:Secretory phospholipase A2 receptor [Microtus ochrogaster]|uniref:Secretory phospholipase A2 receptor n=1 Tax=Microtus ochrogaster TaxID=79684 RepID=A0A8J6GPU1_MICOH|nr:Secretory phospholipase A2 receptor [Microtus ochrogaster]
MVQWLAMLQLLWMQQLLLLGAHPGSAQDLTLTPEPALEWLDKGIFIIQSESLKTCIQAGRSVLTLEDCKQPNKYMLWKWASNSHLFNVGGSGCLGLNLSNPEEPLSLYECDSTLISLRWHCNKKMIMGPLQYKVQVQHGNTVVASWKQTHKWITYMSDGEDICEHLHRDLYTVKGNAHGMPCVFPFQYNQQWHHECTREGQKENLLWCATTSRYERDEKWGYCPDPKQLSREAVEVWIGLNQLDEKAGWQWSDGTALSYLNWSPEISDRPFVEYHCGTLKPPSTAWRSKDCESALPYICKRFLNYTAHETLENDSWTYHATHCDPDWAPFNRNCYKLQKEERTWQEALHSCQTNDSMLMDVTSLAELEFLIDLLGDGNASETWIGLSSNRTPVSFRWSTGSSVIFTNWHPLEPRIFPKRSQLCVSAEQAEGLWKVKGCQERLSYVCKRAGQVLDDDESECPEGWERHGKFCYKIDTVLRNFEEASNGYHCHPALLTVTSRFEQAFLNSFISSVAKTKDSYFWIALQDENNTGEYTWKTVGQRPEPMQYTHWNTHQPSYSGGCVVMRGGSPLGRWEVKDCSNFKAMSLCKMPVKTWDKTELERRWPFRKCYADWESKSGLASCFKVFHSEKVLMKRSWREAEFFCEEFGAQLASFAHIEEEEFVNELLHSKFNRTEERQFWIGFNKRNPLNAGSWEWSDRTPVVSSFLDSTYSEDAARNCAVYKANKTLLPTDCASKHEWICKIPRGVIPTFPDWYEYGLWGTEDCSVSMPSICKREEMWVIEKKKPPLPHGTCPKGWLYFNHKCFQVWIPKDPRELKTWAGAQDFCVDKGGTLVSIESELEQAFITMNLFGQTTNVWIGLKSDNHQTWVNRKPVVYSNWSPSDVINIPNYNTSKMKKHVPLCALMLSSSNFHFTGKWYFDDCGKEDYGFVCEKMQDTPEYRANVSEMHSVPNTLEFGNRTYKIIHANMTWYTARRTCLMHGAELASIADNFQQAFLTVVLSRLGYAHWIGLSTTDNGLNFDWSDGTKSPFTYWKDEESTFLGDCVFADTSGRWHRTACESLLQGAICHVPTETKAFEHPVLCPETSVPWIKFKGNCYSLSTVLDSRSFEDAHEFCKREGSNLLAIKDEAENLFLQEELHAFSSSVQMVWLNAQFDSNRRNHSIVPLAVSLTLMAFLAFAVLCFWIYKQNSGFFQRLTGSRGLYYPTLSFSTAQLEENVHISDLEKNGQ